MPADLKNCPFCGAEGMHDFTFAGPSEVTVYYVKCCNCECSTKFHATESGAAETWNRRADTVECANLQAHNSRVITLPGVNVVETFVLNEYADASINEREKIARIAREVYEYLAGQRS